MKSEWLESNLINDTNLDARSTVKYPNQLRTCIERSPGHFRTKLPRKKDVAILNYLFFFFLITENNSNSWTSNQKDSEF